MKAIIIHLSDIHLKTKKNKVLNRKIKIFEAVQNLISTSDAIFLVITGDIAFSGQEDEYNQAVSMIDYLQMEIQKKIKHTVNIIMVPGNHDCDFTMPECKIRETVISTIRTNLKAPIEEEFINHCCQVQENFNNFQGFYLAQENLVHSDKLLKILEYKYNEYTISFNCLNTSWLSQKNEKYGMLHFPIENYPDNLLKQNSDLIISLLHHPFSWQNPNFSRELRNFFENISDIILTGHEHESSKSAIDHLDGNYIEYIEGYVLQDSDNDQMSGFNVVLLDLETKTQKIFVFKWQDDMYSSENMVTDWIPYKRSSSMRGKYEINSSFEKTLLDPGASFKHPYKAELSLKDFFVFPYLRNLKTQKKGQKTALRETINSSQLCSDPENNNRVILVGAERSGKTSLCRKLFLKYLEYGFIPVLINGSALKTATIADFEKSLSEAFSHEYSKEVVERFTQVDHKKKFIIIDDFNECRLNFKHKVTLLSRIYEVYPNILLTVNEIFQLEEIINAPQNGERVFKDFKQFEILEFGHVLRSSIIEKWNLAGRETILEEGELLKINDRSKNIMDTIIGKNYVPSRPLFLLTILQSIEVGNSHNLKESSYGYYYEYLITQAMIKINLKNEEMDSYHTYLMELANLFFLEKIQWISPQRLQTFNNWFSEEYAVSANLNAYKGNLINIFILQESEGSIRFNYKYVYYFYVARYFANSITQKEVREIVSEMAKRLHQEEFANIVMFLTHLSKDPFILNTILANAEKLFSNFEPIQLGHDIELINELSDEIPKAILENKDVRKAREQKLELKDHVEEIEKNCVNEEKEELPDIDEDITQLDLVAKLDLTIKTIEVIGQILKNYYGSLKALTKVDLCKEAYSAGLRALNSFFSLIEENRNFLLNAIDEEMEKKKSFDKLAVQKISKKILFLFFCIMSYAFIKKISGSVGSESLSKTFEQILVDYNTISTRLIDISIKLDYYSSFPYEDIKAILKEVPRSGLQYTLIQQFVLNYLYMYPTSYKEKQSICNLVGISMEDQRMIDIKTIQRKRGL